MKKKKTNKLRQFSSVCPVIDNEFHHDIEKVVYRSTRLNRTAAATLTATATLTAKATLTVQFSEVELEDA